jgi:hypothetical protein
MKPYALTDLEGSQDTAETHADADPRLSAAVRDAFAAPCPDVLTGRILAAVRDEDFAVRAWPAPWLFALPVVELALLLFLRSEVASSLSLAGRLWATIRDAALPSWQGGVDAARFWWQSANTWFGTALPPQQDLLPWVAAGLLALGLAGTLILKQERRHA